MDRVIYLVRHTQPKIGSGICYGQTDVNLFETFEKESVAIMQKLGEICFSNIYSSPLRRCCRLASLFSKAAVVETSIDNRLVEMNFGDWEGQLWHEITDPLLENWYTYWMDTPAGGAESFLDQYNRVSAFLDEVKERKYRHICLFIHRGTIEAILVYVGQLNLNQAFARPMDFGVRFTVEVE